MIREASTPSLSPVTAHPACPRCGGRLVQARGSHLPAVRLGRLQPQGRDLRDLPAAPAERPPSLLFGRLHVHLARPSPCPGPAGPCPARQVRPVCVPTTAGHYCPRHQRQRPDRTPRLAGAPPAERSVFEALGPAGSTPGIASPAARSTTPTSGRPAQARRKAGRCRQCGQRTAGRVCATHRLLHNALQTARRAAS